MIHPAKLSEMLSRYTASVLLQLTYGHRVISTADDQYVRLSEIALKGTVESGTPGLMPVDLFPVCQLCFLLFSGLFSDFLVWIVKYLPAWLPGMGFKRHAHAVRKDVDAMRYGLFDMAKEQMVSLLSMLSSRKCVLKFCPENWVFQFFGFFVD